MPATEASAPPWPARLPARLRRPFAALWISLALHVAILALLRVEMPVTIDVGDGMIQVRLVPARVAPSPVPPGEPSPPAVPDLPAPPRPPAVLQPEPKLAADAPPPAAAPVPAPAPEPAAPPAPTPSVAAPAPPLEREPQPAAPAGSAAPEVTPPATLAIKVRSISTITAHANWTSSRARCAGSCRSIHPVRIATEFPVVCACN